MPRIKKVVEENSNDTINVLMSQIEEMRKQIEALSKPQKKELDVEQEESDYANEIKISGEDYIKVISLYPSILNLTTEPRGRGKIFSFKQFGEVKRILYRDLVDIMENHTNFLHDGLFLILNRNVVRKHGLDDAYEAILTKDKIEKIMSGNQSDAVNLFKSANEKQQGIIVDLIVDKALAGFEVDLNLLDRLSRIIGYNIAEKIESIKVLRNQ